MIERAKKTGNLITWLRGLVVGRRQELDRHGFFQMRNAFRRQAREADYHSYLELWCGTQGGKATWQR